MSALEGFGPALRALRERAGLRQEDLAEKVGVSRGMIGRYETEKKRPGLETLGKILSAVEADLHDLGVEARRVSGRVNGAPAAVDVRDERVERIDRVAREIGLAVLAEVAERERVTLVQAGLEIRWPSTRGGAE